MKNFSLRSLPIHARPGLAAVLCCGALLLSACGGGSDGSSSTGNNGGGNGDNNQPPPAPPKIGITLLAGDIGGPGYVDGVGALARFNTPERVAVDSAGNVYVAESGNRRIRKVTRAGVVSTLAGSGERFSRDGSGTQASFCNPRDIAVDPSGNVFVVDTPRVRKITPEGTVTTLTGLESPADCSFASSRASTPSTPLAIAVDALGIAYIADGGVNRVYTLTPGGVLTKLAGSDNFNETLQEYQVPRGIAVDAARNVYVTSGTGIAKITPSGQITTLAPASAALVDPGAIAADASGTLFVTDLKRPIVRKVTSSGSASVIAGVEGQPASIDGPPAAARLDYPLGIAVDRDGGLFVSEAANTIRRIDQDGSVSTLAGAATPREPNFAPYHATDRAGNVYVAQRLANDLSDHALRRIAPDGAMTTVLAGGLGSSPQDMVVDRAGNVYVLALESPLVTCINCNVFRRGVLYKITSAGERTVLAGSLSSGSPTQQPDGIGAAATLNGPIALAIDNADNLYVGQNDGAVRKVTPTGVVSTLPAQPFGSFPSLRGMVVAGDDQLLASSCAQTASTRFDLKLTSSVIKIDLRGGGSSTVLAGSPTEGGGFRDGPGPQARFGGFGFGLDCVNGIALDAAGNAYVADPGNNVVRRVTPDGTVSTVVGQQGKGSIVLGDLPGSLWAPTDVSFDAAGNLYVGMAHAIVKVRFGN